MAHNCDKCGEQGKMSTAIIDRKFGDYCTPCITGSNRLTNSAHAQYSRDRDREDNFADLQQPWHSNGKANRHFIEQYPEQSKDMFTEEEMKYAE